MADSANLVCYDCRLVLPLGNFWASAGPGERILTDGSGRPSSHSAGLSRALWRMQAEHVYHELRTVGEASALLDRLEPDFSVIGEDLSLAEYLAGWPG